MRNGWICCEVREDLRRTTLDLLEKRTRWLRPLRFDRLLIETSGLAAPGPLVQTFLLDPELPAQTRVDGVVAMAPFAAIQGTERAATAIAPLLDVGGAGRTHVVADADDSGGHDVDPVVGSRAAGVEGERVPMPPVRGCDDDAFPGAGPGRPKGRREPAGRQ